MMDFLNLKLFFLFYRRTGCKGLLSKTINVINLESEQQQESHHKTEKSHSFGQGETQDGIWEQLLFEWWISGVANDERPEYCSDTSTCNEINMNIREKKQAEE